MCCTGCGHIHSQNYWTEEGLAQVFSRSHSYQMAGGDPDQKRQLWKPVVDNVLRIRGGYPHVLTRPQAPGWLDVGCGDGALVMTADEYGFNAVGLDARKETVRALQSTGYQSMLGDFLNVNLSFRPFVISMMDVLEHIPWPSRALDRVRSMLDPEGVLVISLPNTDSSTWRMLDRSHGNPYWIEIEHYHNFSRLSLTSFLAAHGFDVAYYDIPFRYKAQMELYATMRP